jgi:hypothetical protein
MVLQNNLFAARLGARTLEKEIESLFRLIEEESKSSEFESLFTAAIEASGNDLLTALIEDGAKPEERQTLLEVPQRELLEKYLVERFNRIKAASGGRKKTARFASLFVQDRWGTMIAAAFADETSNTVIGENRAYRSYFNGQSQDSDEAISPRKFQGTKFSHVSAPFVSTATERWKIAVSTPISINFEPTTTEDTARSITGVMVLTINLGDFDLLPDDMPSGPDGGQLAVIVDGHAGTEFEKTQEGKLLQHKAFSQPSWKNNSSHASPKIDEELLTELKGKGTYKYIDPVSRDDAGKAYAGEWIAAMAKVEVLRKSIDSSERREPANLWVLVQARANTVTAPVKNMSGQMMKEGVFALLSMLAMICSLWFFVVWVMRLPESFRSAVRSRSGSATELTGTTSDATLDVDR